MTLETWLAFLGVWLAAAAVPGVNVAFSLAAGLPTPRPPAFLAPLGLARGGLDYAVLVSAGLGTLLIASAEVFAVVNWLGVAYLVWLAWCGWPGVAGRPAVARRRRGREAAAASVPVYCLYVGLAG